MSDDFAYNSAENPVHIRDLNATVLHPMGPATNTVISDFVG